MDSSRRRTVFAAGASIIGAAVIVTTIVVAQNPGNETVATPTVSPSPVFTPLALQGIELDRLEEARISELRDFIFWLEQNDADGFIGELGWSGEGDWQQLADYWYQVADAHGLETTAWAAGSHWGDEYALTIYGSRSDELGLGLDRAERQAEIVELPGRTARHGVNLAGLEFGVQNPAFSTEQPGVLEIDYFTEPEASFAYLAERGITLVRLPFRWERLQPKLGGQLDASYASTIEAMLDAAALHGIDVVLDLHNYGAFETDAATLLMGSPELPDSALADVWLRIADRWGEHPAVYAYGLMNEPHSLPGASVRDAARRWEITTQRTVDALRAADHDTLLMVAGYDFSSLPRWRDNHPEAWITDPADNFRYEAHHYWDSDAEGFYELSYADELALLGG